MIKVMIREAAKRRGLENAYQFGQSIGVKRMVASRIWNNDQPPKLKTLDRICNAWGCGLEELIAHKRDKPSVNGHTSASPQKRKQKPRDSVKPNAGLSASKRSRSIQSE